MSLVINTNINSLTAQNNLANSQASLSTSLQRLSSGLRINSAADDPAGLAIASRFTTQINGLNQAVRNANDGISLAQTAGGALQEVVNNLQAIRTLAVEAANATNSASDRSALDQEVQQRISEINRIATQTNFNNQNILDGTFGNATFQVGANVGQTITLGLNTSVKTGDIGAFVNQTGTAQANTVTNTAGTAAQAVLLTTTGANSYAGVTGTPVVITSGTSNVIINSTNVATAAAGSLGGQTVGSAYATAAAINASGIAGVQASANTSLTFDPSGTGGPGANNFLNASALSGGGSATYALSINGVANVINTSFSAVGSYSLTNAVNAINSFQSQTGVTATISNGKLVLTAADGRDVHVQETVGGVASTATTGQTASTLTSVFSTTTETAGTGTTPTVALAGATDLNYRGQVTLQSSSQVQIGGSGGPALLGFAPTATTLTPTQSLAAMNVLTVSGANQTIQSVDSALTAVNSLDSTFGAVQNRLTSTVANLSTAATNLSSARSGIQDANFAQETANLTRAQILQQAGVSILAQANTLPQAVLKLLA